VGAISGRPRGGAVGGSGAEGPTGCGSSGPVIGMDLGGTYLRAALADQYGRVVLERRVETLAHEGREAVLERVVALLNEVKGEAGGRGVSAVGVGAPGPLDPDTGIVRRAPMLPGWEDVPLAGVIEERVGVAAVLGNDANVAALGELAYGAGMGAENLIYLTISTGIGGGFVAGGELLEGRRGAAGEVGHVVVEPGGPECSCGGRGHLEALASGTAIARQAREALSSGEDTILGKLSGGDSGRVTAELAHEAALAGDPLCRGLLGAAGRCVGHALVGLVHLFNPEVIVLGGGVTGAGELFWGPLRETLWGGLIPTFAEGLKLEKSALGDHAGLYGAAELALRAVRDAPAIIDASAELRAGKGGPRG
jgi:glucokinase